MNVDSVGRKLPNGTWTAALGLLQSGTVDTWSGASFLTPDRSSDFLYPTPFIMEKYGALLRRPTTFIDINVVTAGLVPWIYAVLFAVMGMLFLGSWLSEWWLYGEERNHTWHLILSLFPCNGHMWPKQRGVVRKCLMTTTGFGILMLSSLYQARYSEQLMIPYPVPVVTLHEIENMVSSGHARLLIDDENSPVERHIANVSVLLRNSLTSNPPVYFMNEPNPLRYIDEQNGIFIHQESTLLAYLREIKDPSQCSHYLYVPIDEWGRSVGGLIISKTRADVLEKMNRIVAERMRYVDRYMERFQLEEECRKHIFPVYTPDPTYDPLKLVELSGTFLLLIPILGASVFVLLCEMVFARFTRFSNVETFDFHVNFCSNLPEYKLNMIRTKYGEILDLIEK